MNVKSEQNSYKRPTFNQNHSGNRSSLANSNAVAIQQEDELCELTFCDQEDVVVTHIDISGRAELLKVELLFKL